MTKVKSPKFVPEINLYCVVPNDIEYPFIPNDFNCMYGYPTWSGIALARYILDNPDQFKGLDITEVGCGSGIVSIAAAKVGANVTSIDRDIASLYFTEQNLLLNNFSSKLIWGNLKDIQTDYVMFSSIFYDKSNNIQILRLFETKKVIFGASNETFDLVENFTKIYEDKNRNMFIFSSANWISP